MSGQACDAPVSPIDGLHTVDLVPDGEARLQRFFEANPAYFLAVQGEPAGPGEAHEEIHGELPAGWPYTRKWVVGFAAADGELAAMANVVSDLLAPGVWHLGTFIVATERHGRGDALRLYAGLEDWARRHGAAWLRLGVVQGHARAERFWQGRGFTEVRLRHGLPFGALVRTVRVMVKPLAGGTVDEYLARVPRDRPDVPAAPG